MKYYKSSISITIILLNISGCATQPMGPTLGVLPAPDKPFDEFQRDQSICKDYAFQQTKGQADSANQRAVGAALLGAALGAGLGAAVGGGRGAGIGAASGSVAGTGIGIENSNAAQNTIQQQYNIAYGQCMYGKGNQVAGFETPINLPPLTR